MRFCYEPQGFANTMGGKLTGLWKLFGMRNIDTLMKKTAPKWWYNRKRRKLYELAEQELKVAGKFNKINSFTSKKHYFYILLVI